MHNKTWLVQLFGLCGATLSEHRTTSEWQISTCFFLWDVAEVFFGSSYLLVIPFYFLDSFFKDYFTRTWNVQRPSFFRHFLVHHQIPIQENRKTWSGLIVDLWLLAASVLIDFAVDWFSIWHNSQYCLELLAPGLVLVCTIQLDAQCCFDMLVLG